MQEVREIRTADGRSARLLRGICRAGLVVLLLTAPATLWWPSVPGWAAFTAALMTIWGAWICWRILAGQRTIPTHPIHLALAIVAAGAVAHLVAYSRMRTNWPGQIGGEFNASLMMHMGLLALLVLLCQDLLTKATLGATGQTLLGLSAFAGAVAALVLSRAAHGHLMAALMGWAGVAVFVRPLVEAARLAAGTSRARVVRLAIAVVMSAVLTVLCPASLTFVAAALAVTALMAAALLKQHRAMWLLAALVAAASAVLQASAWQLHILPRWPVGAAQWLGRGEAALADYDTRQSGLSLLAGVIGWAGAAAVLILLLAGLLRIIWPWRSLSASRHGEALLMVLAALLALAAWLAPAGLFCPAVNVMLAVVWAALPGAFGRPAAMRSGWWLLGCMLLVALTHGLSSHRGLMMWMLFVFGHGDLTAHTLVGLFLTLLLLWLLDGRRWGPWVALAAGLAAGPGGELAQQLFSSHRAESPDVLAHMLGAAVALVAYALCRLARWAQGPRWASGAGEEVPGR